MKIRRILLENYRTFERLEFHLHPKMTVLVGENGRGKTSLMHALRLILWSYIRNYKSHFRHGATPNLQHSDVHHFYHDKNETTLPAYPCSVRGEIFFPENGNFDAFDSTESLDDDFFFNDSIGCTLSNKNSKPRWTKGNLSDLRAIEKVFDVIYEDFERLQGDFKNFTELPVVACYGTNRLWKKNVKFKNIDRDTHRLAGYDGATNLSSSFLKFEWFIWTIVSLSKEGFIEKSTFKELWLGVREAIYSVTSWEILLPKNGEKEFLFRQPGTPELKLSQMGDGVRGMIGLIGDLASRCALLNPYHGKSAIKNTSGVVLIDEIDLHLHPRWQQKILAQLQKAFPKIQFIVTTHSPQVLSTIPAECIRVLRLELNQEKKRSRIVIQPVTQQTQGVASSDILSAVMDIDPVPDMKPSNQLSEYKALIQQDLEGSIKGLKLRTDLEAHFGANHPLMLECQRLIRLQALKRKLPSRALRNHKE